MLYTKKITDITYDDVIVFCSKGIKENEILEYKSVITAKLDRVISSMANTYGGHVIIGIGDEDGRPKPPFLGIDYTKGIEERITQILISNIFPPILPGIQVCPSDDKKHAFIVIRIAESDATPHYVLQKTLAYVRTGNITSPEKIADVNEIEWLRNKRQKAIAFREFLIDNSGKHYTTLAKLAEVDIALSSEIFLSACPLFPSKTLVVPSKIEELFFKVNGSSRITYNEFQYYTRLPIQYGLATFLVHRGSFEYIEINQFGLAAKRRNLEWEKKKPSEEEVEDKEVQEGKFINFEEIFLGISSFLEFIYLFYEAIGYYGYCKFDVSLRNILNISLRPYVGGGSFLSNGVSIAEGYLLPEKLKTISMPTFGDQNERLGFLIEVSEDIARAFGSEIDPDPRMASAEFLKRYALLKRGG